MDLLVCASLPTPTIGMKWAPINKAEYQVSVKYTKFYQVLFFLVWMYFHPTTVPSSYVDFVVICTDIECDLSTRISEMNCANF